LNEFKFSFNELKFSFTQLDHSFSVCLEEFLEVFFFAFMEFILYSIHIKNRNFKDPTAFVNFLAVLALQHYVFPIQGSGDLKVAAKIPRHTVVLLV
jgi:hypothetical protein